MPAKKRGTYRLLGADTAWLLGLDLHLLGLGLVDFLSRHLGRKGIDYED